MRKLLRFLAIFWMLAAPGRCFGSGLPGDTAAATPSPYGPEMVLGFAEYLYASGDYLRAAGEYQRFLFLEPGAAGADSMLYRAAQALLLAGAHAESDRLLLELQRRYPSSRLRASVPLYRSIVAYESGDDAGALSLAGDPSLPRSELRGLVRAAAHLRLREVAAARSIACGEDASGSALTNLCAAIESAGPIPRRSPLFAGALSALVPGAGKIYCRRYADGLYALIVVGLAAWQAADGFDKDGVDSTRGWIFGALGGGFYLGNVYGSAVAADMYNRGAYESFLSRIRITIALPQ